MKKIVLLFGLTSLLLVGACDKAADDAKKTADRTAERREYLDKKEDGTRKEEFKQDKSGDGKKDKSGKGEKDEDEDEDEESGK